MKNILLILFVIFFGIVCGQKNTSIKTLDVRDFNTSDLQKYKKKIQVLKLVIDDNITIENGTKLRVGNISNNNITTYSDASRFGSTVIAQSTSYRNYSTIFIGKTKDVTSLLFPPFPMTEDLKDNIIVVRDIYLVKFNNAFSFYVECVLENNNVGIVFIAPAAFQRGEIESLNRHPSKEEAIKELEEKKRLFDLGVISSEEFEKIKEDLKPILLSK